MLKRMLFPALLLALAVQGPPVQARPDRDDHQGRREDRDDRRDRREDRDDRRGHREDRDDRRDRRDDRRGDRGDRDDRGVWQERGRDEQRFWADRDREGRRYERHRYEDERHPHRYLAPPWMAGYWRPQERHYVALVPGDPSRCYVFLEGRWVLRQIQDPRARLDLEGAFRLPVAPPPIPPPHIGLNLHVVLFN